ncbi:hypothetical protein JNUCC31_15825 [Paenibacillus sp. JNUCC31]|uniref:hypothetical protein n=1 Tax=Paenibacillus sp. JNUCC-31 TaxID=2777983 RepID=UPI001782BFD3|nr:hypothetical protein [Paenibacillus sp. JNUCC-31]QOS82163.1 hypothetical protein JNUCC31_15825 [Paenibacillus sp. JNUCC-31]
MSKLPEHITQKRRSSGMAVIGMSWLTMTLGLFFATLAGELARTMGTAEWMCSPGHYLPLLWPSSVWRWAAAD